MELKITINDNGLLDAIENARERLSNLSPVLEKIAAVAAADVRKNFTEKGRYDSPDDIIGGTKKWEPHSPATKKIKERKGLRGPYAILAESGRLVQSITGKAEGKDKAVVGTNVEYARRMHYGSKKSCRLEHFKERQAWQNQKHEYKHQREGAYKKIAVYPRKTFYEHSARNRGAHKQNFGKLCFVWRINLKKRRILKRKPQRHKK